MIFWSRNWSWIGKLYIFTKKQDILRFAFAKVMIESWVVFVMVLLWPSQNFAHRCTSNLWYQEFQNLISRNLALGAGAWRRIQIKFCKMFDVNFWILRSGFSILITRQKFKPASSQATCQASRYKYAMNWRPARF